MTPEIKLSKARAHMILNAPFYATLALSMEFVRRDDIETMATDGKSIFYNPQFVMDCTDSVLRGVVAHECAHVANLHHTRRGNRDPKQWNIACDYAIDGQLAQDGFEVAQFGFVNPEYNGKSAEQIFKMLGDGQGNQQPQPQPQGAPQPQGQPQPGQGQGQPQTAPQGTPQGTPQPGKGAPSNPARPGDVLDAAPDQAGLQAAELEAMAKTLQAASAAKMAGKGSAMGALAVAKIKRPVIDWRAVLRRYVDSAARADYQWHRPNRRHLHSGTYLPGKVPDAMGALVVIFDVSGSTCDPKTLATFISELQGAIEDASPESVDIIQCNTKITKRDKFIRGDEIKVALKGGGGTNMQPAIDAIEDAAACIVFTDCEFSRDPIDTHGVPTLWAKWGEHPTSPAWGEVIELP